MTRRRRAGSLLRQRSTAPTRGERGASAVEFALVVPVLLLLVFGIAEFGRAYNTQAILSGAAREGVRSMALHNSPANAKIATKAAAPSLTLTDAQITVSPSTCTVTGLNPPVQASVLISYSMPMLTRLFRTSPIVLTGKGVMLCNG
jgi:Flp pilus assembly protein TadG